MYGFVFKCDTKIDRALPSGQFSRSNKQKNVVEKFFYMRKILMAFIVVVTISVLSAFSVEREQQPGTFSQYWYQLIPNGDPGNYLDYERVGTQPCSGSSSNVCGVFAEQYSGSDIEHPNLNQIATTVFKP